MIKSQNNALNSYGGMRELSVAELDEVNGGAKSLQEVVGETVRRLHEIANGNGRYMENGDWNELHGNTVHIVTGGSYD